MQDNHAIATDEAAMGVDVQAIACFCLLLATDREECPGEFVPNSSTFIISRTGPINELKIVQVLQEFNYEWCIWANIHQTLRRV